MLTELPRFLRRVVFATLALVMPASTVGAQAEYRVTNFVRTTRGFNATLLFRNVQGFGASEVIGLQSLGVRLSDRLHTPCRTFSLGCSIGASPFQTGTEGSVDTRTFEIAGTRYSSFISYWNSEDSCTAYCERFYPNVSGGTLGLLGCSVPLMPSPLGQDYAGRTCDAEGFTGWLRKDLVVFLDERVPTPFDLGPSDLIARFFSSRWGPDAYPQSIVPEPSTYALVATGLAGIALIRRRRKG
jgi:hypothetical protein